MFYKSKIQCYALVLLSCFALFECVTEIPCASMKAIGGYVCVCNDTYCDTILRPHPKKGTFIQYMTSELSPGFTKVVGHLLKPGASKHTSNNASTEFYIQVTDTIQCQTFNGVGGSITDSTGIALSFLGQEAQKRFFESCFGTSGVEYSMVRVPIAASDFSLTSYSYDDVPGDVNLNNFTLNEVDFTIKIPFIKAAQNVSKRGIKVLGTPWTAPSWMKINNKTSAGYLWKDYMSVFAHYIYKFVDAYYNEGIEIWGITQGNEVILPILFGSFFPMANTLLLPNQARDFSKIFGPLIKQSKFKDLKVFLLDDERPFMTWYSDRVLIDNEAAQYVDGIALHWYFDSDASLSRLEMFLNSYPNKSILYSESSINGFQTSGGTVDLGDWSRAARYIDSMMQTLSRCVMGYIDWNIALDEQGGPRSTGKMSLDSQIIINMTKGEFYKQPIHYGMGHFSKFIQLNAKILNTTIQQNTTEIYEEHLSMEYLINAMKGKFPKSTLKETLESSPTKSSLYDTPTGSSPGPGPSTANTPPVPIPTPLPKPDKVSALAAKNPDGTHTLIVYSSKSESINITVADAELGMFQATIDPNSINSFCYK